MFILTVIKPGSLIINLQIPKTKKTNPISTDLNIVSFFKEKSDQRIIIEQVLVVNDVVAWENFPTYKTFFMFW